MRIVFLIFIAYGAYWTIRRQTNLLQWLTGQLADKPTRGQSNRGLDISRTGQLADNEFKKTWNYYTLFVH